MIAVLCCGPLFDERALIEEGGVFAFLDTLLSSKEEKVGQEKSHNRIAIFLD
jgi:hypothetical protein